VVVAVVVVCRGKVSPEWLTRFRVRSVAFGLGAEVAAGEDAVAAEADVWRVEEGYWVVEV